ncbi:hypothetical protein ACFV2V_31225 [Streptomyces sp. NPDC059698]|uniref:hypothetical protein n=1 Tax=unclassified Streptomyces TaxID=2593676 RepID=UPI00093CFD9C|nr:hypothetical protein [Streptomyces sp. CB02366]OKJ29863.1 hypothetical protein AMK24_29495 [Streptomyces sp. CB02366]
MGVTVTKTGGGRAEITWDPQTDDPQGHIAKLVETDRLAHVLEAIAGTRFQERGTTEAQALAAAYSTSEAARLLDRRSATQTVELHDQYKVGWKRIAEAVRGDATAQSSIRRKYEQGLRYLGRPDS